MKPPAHYLLATQPPGPTRHPGYLPQAHAEQAIAAAVAETQKYYHLLLRALRRRSKPENL